jgi:RNA polymerase sigma-70 factor, ECF subfamily
MYLSRAEPLVVRLPSEPTDGFASTPTPTDDELIRRIERDDEAALMALYERYAGFVTAIAIRVLGDRGLAEEVVQDTFLRCWHNVDSFNPSRGRVVAWLFGIARNRAIDTLRSRSNQARRREWSRISDAAPSTTPEMSDLVALREVMATALSNLPPEQRQIVELAYYGGLTQAEIARQLGTPLGTIKTRSRAAMEKLRAELRPFFNTDVSESGDGTR